MRNLEIPSEMTDILLNAHFSYLCTSDLENQPHITPMFFVFDEEEGYPFVLSSSKSKKMSNILVNPKVSLTVDIRDPVNPFNNRGIMIQGIATIEKNLDSCSRVEKDKISRIYQSFLKKYPVLKEKAQLSVIAEAKILSETLVMIVPKKIVYWKGPRFITISSD